MTFVYAEFPLGANNGQNLDFRLANTPNPTSGVYMLLDGVKLKNTLDFTVTGNNIHMAFPPMPQDVFVVYYTY